jgi:hypothetical protein
LIATAQHVGKKTVAIVQSCYIPWKGYFDLINSVDEFVLFDDRQFTRRDWRNRNRIKTPSGTHWLTIPVQVAGRYHQRIDETVVSDRAWARRHWKTLAQAYAAAPHFNAYGEHFREAYEELDDEPRLSAINRRLLQAVCDVLGIRTKLGWSTEYVGEGSRTERLVSLCRQTGATRYLTGPRARDYINTTLFEDAAIALTYMDYEGYRPYPQLHPPFEHSVTVLDLIFNTGMEAQRYMKSFD